MSDGPRDQTTEPLHLYERVARIIRTQRLKASNAPAEDVDLETARLIVTEVVNDYA